MFRFKVPPVPHPPQGPAALDALVGRLLAAVLDVAAVTKDGEVLEPDGFLYHRDVFNEASTPLPLYAEEPPAPSGSMPTSKQLGFLRGGQETEEQFYDPAVLRRTEPRIDLLLQLASVLNDLAEVEVVDGRVVAVSLRDLGHWTTASNGDPYEVIACLSRNCNARCEFCYVHGNPADSVVRLNASTTERSGREASDRLAFYERGLALPQPTYDLEETLLHPSTLPVLERVRKATGSLISITTNGYTLTERTVERIKGLDPVEVTLSLNSANPEIREALMGGRARRGLNALKLLDRAGVCTTATLVAWPTVPLDDLVATIRHADAFDIRSVNVILGGYTRFFPNPPEFETFGYWRKVVERLLPLRNEIEHPLAIQPGIYVEQVLEPETLGRSLVTGVSPGSPAHRGGIRVGDVITEIAGRPVLSRSHCYAMLALLRDTERAAALVTVERDGVADTLTLPREGMPGYRYGPPTNDRFGIHLVGGSPPISAIRDIFQLAGEYAAEHTLVITSQIVQPLLETMLQEWAFLDSNPQARIRTLAPRCRFYGGTVVLGDLLTVGDIADAVAEYRADHGTPDLVLVPSASFNSGGWFRDIRGRTFFELRRRLGIPCEPLIASNFE
ncbi:radical SAM protein [Amycolatopsis sp. WGS_07]|uniref:radical SAM protein n=1 Tax=Amycolatopsis sp. WGS_07 TaxID=3076764 RepID=UPI00387391CB